MEGGLRIGQLARRVGVSTAAIRFYERSGVLPEPERSDSGYRLYAEEAERRLRFVKACQRLGLTLGEIRDVLAFRDRGERPCAYVAGVVDHRLGQIGERLEELRSLQAELTALRDRMRRDGADATREAEYCAYIESVAAAGDPG